MNTDKIYAEAIANEYAPKDTSKVVALKKLDNKAKMPANIFAFSFGTIMAMVLGTGMCFSMKVIGNGSTSMMAVGIIVGNTFLERHDFSGKKIVLFATSGGSGFGNTVGELKPSALNAVIEEGKVFGKTTKQEIAEWVKHIS